MSWQRNLKIMVLVQLVMMAGYSSMAPFLPFFVKELGINAHQGVSIWAGLLASVSPLFAALFSPLWGSLADRYGRKPMVVRSCFAAGSAVFSISLATNVYQVLALRILQGVFGGYSAAATALVAGETPAQRLGWALGLLQTGQTLGVLIGPTLGGAIADHFSYRAVFTVNGLLAMGAGLITLTSVHEAFRPQKTERHQPLWAGVRQGLAQPAIGSMFLVLFLAQFAIRNVEPVLSLYVQELTHSQGYLGTLTGIIFAVTGLAQVIGLFLAGRYADRLGYRSILLCCLLASAAFYLPQALVANVWQLLLLRLALGLFVGSIVPMANAVIGQLAPQEFKGSIFGFTSTALFLGNFSGPLVGGLLAAYLGLRTIFPVTACLLFLNFLWAYRSVPRGRGYQSRPDGTERGQATAQPR